MKNFSFNYELLLKKIDNYYNGNRLEKKITRFCSDIKIKIYRFKRIIDNKAYFQNDEIYRIIDLLDIKDKEIKDYFFKIN